LLPMETHLQNSFSKAKDASLSAYVFKFHQSHENLQKIS
jgi:hypothetical protein